MKLKHVQIIIASSLLFLFLSLSSYASEDVMKIAVASTGIEQNSVISHEAGRSPFFLFFDWKGNLIKAVENPAKDKPQNAGVSAAEFLEDEDITHVIAENFGRKMQQILDEEHIKYIEKRGTAHDAVQAIIKMP
jgi:predicted Fe-Mo cluster-binding NifX family protein